jgi:membrane protein required for colicin V production
MIWIDFAIIGVIFISLVIGLMRGLIREALSLITWILAIWVGLNYGRSLSGFLEQFIAYPSIRMAVSFLILFFLTLILGSVIGYLLGELIKKTGLTGSDRFAGMIFGIGRGLLVVAILVMLAGMTPIPEDPWWNESKLIPPFQSLAIWLRDNMPADLTDYIYYSDKHR